MVSSRNLHKFILLCVFCTLTAAKLGAQSWESISPMYQARFDAKCVELRDGTILVAGGQDNSGALSECEIYDPLKDHWSITGSLNQARYRYSLIALNDGRALAIGGLTTLGDATTETCELYDPSTKSWKFTTSLPEASENVAALKLPNGKVFIAGGLDANVDKYLDFDFIFDPVTETLTRLPDMRIGRTGLLLYNNPAGDTLMVCGGEFDGFSGYYLRSTCIYSLTTNTWALADSSIEPHDNGQIMAIEMPDNKPLLVSGRSGPNILTPNVEAFDWNTDSWSHIGEVFRAQWHCYAFRVGNDSIILIGGSTPDYQNVSPHTTWFQYSTKQSWAGPDMINARFLYTGLLYTLPTSLACSDSEFVFVFGGADTGSKALSTCEKLAVKSDRGFSRPSLLHRELASAYYGDYDTLPMALDVSAALDIDSLWPSLTELSGTFAWDSSVVQLEEFLPPTGWRLRSLANNGNSADFSVQRSGGSPTAPLLLGTAVFQPTSDALATSWVSLPDFSLTAGGETFSLCVTDDEDSHWGVRTLGIKSGVSIETAGGVARIYPNPVETAIHVENPASAPAAVSIYDALGREVTSGKVPSASTGSFDISRFSSGVYFVRTTIFGQAAEHTIVKP